KLGLKLLQDLKPAQIEQFKDAERYAFTTWQLRLYLSMGKVKEVKDLFRPDPGNQTRTNLQAILGPAFDQYEALLGAALGDYRQLDASVERMENELEYNLQKDLKRKLAYEQFLAEAAQWQKSLEWQSLRKKMPTGLPGPGPLPGAIQPLAGWLASDVLHRPVLDNLQKTLPCVRMAGELRFIRGLMALEQGDTDSALVHFRTCLRRIPAWQDFEDRPIAQRYLQLLERQRGVVK